jgi:hypothetical protein
LVSPFKKLFAVPGNLSQMKVFRSVTLATHPVPLISGFAYFLSTFRLGKSLGSDTENRWGYTAINLIVRRFQLLL